MSETDCNNNKPKPKRKSKTLGLKRKSRTDLDRFRGRKSAECPYGFVYSHRPAEEQVYAVKFNHFVTDRRIFAVAFKGFVRIYECVDPPEDVDSKGFEYFRIVIEYKDEDEYFYALAWGYDPYSKSTILAAGGKNRIVRAITVNSNTEKVIMGHTGAINDLKFHPYLHQLLLTASEDLSIRLVNASTGVTIAMFYGPSAHRDQVLSIDFNHDATHFVSGGMDHSILVWKLDAPEIVDVIRKGLTHQDSEEPFPTLCVYEPIYRTRNVHSNYVDSVIWFGQDFSFITRSCEGDVVWWKFVEGSKKNAVKKYHCFRTKNKNNEVFWFIRMELDPQQQYLVLANINERVAVWDLESNSPRNIKLSFLPTTKFKLKDVNMAAFSLDSKTLITVGGDGQVARFDIKN